ncbi:MAG: hypothetical protein L3K14_07505 [Thermoplasmata archaeon]|nr:hypothetical protein [Thermoplasmata archaeon]
MVSCPVCGDENPIDAVNCRSCQLATSLFEPVREAAGPSAGDSDDTRAIAEILAAVGAEPEELDLPSGNAGSMVLLTSQARFPALPRGEVPSPPRSGTPLLPVLPMLLPGSGLSLVQRQVEELLQVGRREGLDLKETDQRMLSALKAEDRTTLDDVRRSVFVQVAAAVAEDLEIQSARRNELAALVPTGSIDAELASGRTSFATGDLSGAVRRARQASDGLSTLEERWATCQILTTEADLMVETIRELGEDPGPALGPLAEGRRLARAGGSDRAERVLAGANQVLWALLVPGLTASLQVIRQRLHGRSATSLEIAPVVRELRQLGALIRRRNFGAAVTTYRRLRTAAATLSGSTST